MSTILYHSKITDTTDDTGPQIQPRRFERPNTRTKELIQCLKAEAENSAWYSLE